MIDLSPLKAQLGGKPIAIVGLGKSGMPVYEACKRAGIPCVLWDDNEAARQAAAAAGATVEDVTQGDFSRFSALCLSPGIPLTHPKPHAAVARARAAGVEVLGDIELFHRAMPRARTIGITGTNGKSTTTALIGHVLKECGIECAVGGNIGEAVLTLPALSDKGVYVIELSSYQTDLSTTFAPDIALFINISPDHLDRHGDIAGYVAAKERIFRGAGHAVIGVDDPDSAAVYQRQKSAGHRECVAVSVRQPLKDGIYVDAQGTLFDGGREIASLKDCPSLQGSHNWQNAAMAYQAARLAGAKTPDILRALHSFPGLAHRQNIVARQNGVTYINDSKATNDQAAAQALRTYNPVYWIAGGKPKDGGYHDCQKQLGHVRHAFLIGQAEEEMAKWLAKNNVPFTRCATLARATEEAHRMAQQEKLAGATVLLSPACASFDQFKSFEQRGDAFVEKVRSLIPSNGQQQKGPRP